MGCQPIPFVGSGLSKRYFNGPSWDELLAYLAKSCPLIDKDYAYYKQALKSLPRENSVTKTRSHAPDTYGSGKASSGLMIARGPRTSR